MRSLSTPREFVLLEDERAMLQLCLEIARDKFRENSHNLTSPLGSFPGAPVKPGIQSLADQFTRQAEQAEAMRVRFEDATSITIGATEVESEDGDVFTASDSVKPEPEPDWLREHIALIESNLPAMTDSARVDQSARLERLRAALAKRTEYRALAAQLRKSHARGGR